MYVYVCMHVCNSNRPPGAPRPASRRALADGHARPAQLVLSVFCHFYKQYIDI